jgi:hypothetical protein
MRFLLGFWRGWLSVYGDGMMVEITENKRPEIERDPSDPTREYIPLPGGWEVQTKGAGSTYRLLYKPSGQRKSILSADISETQTFVTRMAKDIFNETQYRDDKIEGLECDLDSALDVLWRRGDDGARDWISMNYRPWLMRRGLTPTASIPPRSKSSDQAPQAK